MFCQKNSRRHRPPRKERTPKPPKKMSLVPRFVPHLEEARNLQKSPEIKKQKVLEIEEIA